MMEYLSAPIANSPEAHGLPADAHAEYWRAHALGIKAVAVILAENGSELSVTTEIVLHNLNREAALSGANAKIEELAQLCNTDPLTGIHNRRGIEVEYAKYYTGGFVTNRRHGVVSLPQAYALVIDLDDFKKVNEDGGHPAGDLLLRKVAAILQDNTRPKDTKARWGGDEFLVLMLDLAADRAKEKADVIRAQVKKLTSTTVSIGVSSVDFTRELEKTVEEADTALFMAKLEGKDCVICL